MAVDGSPMDQRHFRNALGRFVTGVTVITTRTPEGKLEGLTANSFAAVSLDPPLVLWSLRKSSSLIAVFEAAQHFAVNVLGAWQFALAEHFAKRMPDKFQNVVHAAGVRRLARAVRGAGDLRVRQGGERRQRRPHRLLRPRGARHLPRGRAADLQRRPLRHARVPRLTRP